MATWDVRRARVFGQYEQSTGIDAYHHLVDLVMQQEPYHSAKRVFGSPIMGHRTGARSLSSAWPNGIHTPSRFTRRYTRVGSTKSRYTSQSCNARFSHRRISLTSRPSRKRSSSFRHATNNRQSLLNGNSHARIWIDYSANWRRMRMPAGKPSHRRHKIRHRIYEQENLVSLTPL